MASVKAIKQRITNVGTTKKIMKAMDMVSAAKLQKARERLETACPFFVEANCIIERLKGQEELEEHLFIKERKVKNTAYIILTSDRGLCGSYNINIAEKALAHMNQGKNEQLLVVGAKGNDYFKRRKKNIMSRIVDLSEVRMYEETGLISELVTSLYTAGDVDEVFLAYTHFESTLNYVPRVEKMLPLPQERTQPQEVEDMTFEPNASSFLDSAMPLYLHAFLYTAMAESVACEHAARMINMDSAGKNATEIIDDLNRLYNRKRQAAITQELNEIIGGANLLN